MITTERLKEITKTFKDSCTMDMDAKILSPNMVLWMFQALIDESEETDFEGEK